MIKYIPNFAPKLKQYVMKRILLAFTFLCAFSTFAQELTLSGKVLQQASPLPSVEVVLYLPNRTPLKSVLTDEAGQFSLLAVKGNYTLEVRQLGEVLLTKVIALNTDLKLGNLEVNATQVLSEVIVSGKRKVLEQKTDRLIFNVENSVMASSGNAIDALKATPSLLVTNDKISLIGKASMRVLINDRLVQMSGEELQQYLASLSAGDIKSIEVITTPPAKYDAEGKGGLVNIVLKKKVSDSWNNSVRLGYTQAVYPIANVSNTFNFKKNKWNISATANAQKGYSNLLTRSEYYYPTETWLGTQETKTHQDYLSARLGIDYDLTERASIGGIYSGFFSERDNTSWGKTTISNAGSPLGQIVTEGANNPYKRNHAANVHYIQRLDTLGRKLTLEGDYFHLKDGGDNRFSSFRTGNKINNFHTRDLTDRQIDNYSVKIDMEHPFKWANLSYGAKYSYTRTRNDLKNYDLLPSTPVLNTLQSNAFDYRETVQALYLSAQKQLGEHWEVQAGLRLERTLSKGTQLTTSEVHERDMTGLFPTLYFSYTPNDNHAFNLSLDRRIERPQYWQLNPFRIYESAYMYREGNPFLDPEYENSIEFKHSYKEKLITEVYGLLDTNGADNVGHIDFSTQQQYLKPANYVNMWQCGLIETLVLQPAPWWESTNALTIYTKGGYTINGYTEETMGWAFTPNGWNVDFESENTLTLNPTKTLMAEVSFLTIAPHNELTAHVGFYSYVNAGLKALLLGRKLILSLTANDIFNFSAEPNYTTIHLNGMKQRFHYEGDMRQFKLNLQYNFGNKKVQVQKRGFGNEEEQGRT